MCRLRGFAACAGKRVKGGPALALAAALGAALSFGAAAQPSVPSGLAAAPGDAEATLSWTDPSDDAITGYSVRHAASEAALSAEAWSAISGSDAASAAHTVPRLTNGERYYFQVRASSSDGDGPPSNVATTRLAASPAAVVAINDIRLRTRVWSGASVSQPGLTSRSWISQPLSGGLALLTPVFPI